MFWLQSFSLINNSDYLKNKKNRLTSIYEQQNKDNLKLYTDNHLGIINRLNINLAFQSGGSVIVSTIDDYSKFATMLMF